MSKDITTQFTKQRNKECGRKGYGFWEREKVTVIPPKQYGSFIKKRGK